MLQFFNKPVRYLLLVLICCGWRPVAVVAQDIPAVKAAELAALTNSTADSVYIINFWATWCRPCIAEMPHLITVWKKYRQYKVQLLLVSLDEASGWQEKLRSFARKRHIDASLAWLKETDADYFCNRIDPRWSGAIPATLIIRPATGYRAFYETDFTEAAFEAEVKRALGFIR